MINDVKTKIDKFLSIPYVIVNYNPIIKCIEFDNNPLKYTPNSILVKIKNETQIHPGLQYYHDAGRFDTIYKTYNIEN